MALHNEIEFENEICEHLAAHGWLYSPTDESYDRERALFPEDVFGWLGDTAPDELAKVLKPGLNPTMLAKAKLRVLDRLVSVMGADPFNGGGTLNALKKSIGVTPATLRMFQPKPADGLNPATVRRYGLNRLRVMRQVHYSTANNKSLDLVFFLNGIPVATVELKTDLTQDAEAALKQYKQDRNPKGEPLLSHGRGALVHFVVSNQEVHMTTKLEGPSTRFLPFNAGNNNGAGNAPREGASPTAYFWEDLLDPEAWLTVLGKFIHYRFEEDAHPITGKKSFKASTRFPRYHQWHAVNALATTALTEGPGHNYLIQHSAGSGKTDSIAWTAYRLASLHREEGSKVFDGVIVISDRNILDGQLQRAIEQLETVAGVFAPITRGSEGSKAKQLADALLKGRQIIGVTLQTFPHAMEEIRNNKGLAGRNYAVIADEAHSSQSGDAAISLKKVLLSIGLAEGEDITTEDVLAAEMAARAGGTMNLSFFAFTATPKAKTIELFGRPDENGNMEVFDLYSMKQAIEEGFILDVLQNYTTYTLAAKIAQADQDAAELEVDRDQGTKQLMQWVKLHPHNIAQKVAIIVEHFRENVAHHLAGRAKAMVVTSSRKEAVRYKLAIDKYLQLKGYQTELAALVAFSGEVTDPDSGPDAFTEHTMNPGLKGRSLTKAFGTDEFQIMLVANKFQTGFDQPLLVGMYVDKKLSGIAAVQTLSRLNRVIPGKDRTYVLDFVNDTNTILEAFQTYYEDASVQEASNPDIIHDMIMKLDSMGIYNDRDVDLAAQKWVAQRNHNGLVSRLKPAIDVFNDRQKQAVLNQDTLELEQLDEFRKTAGAFNKSYDFFSQIIDYGNTRIEKLAIYLKLLARALHTGTIGNNLDLSDVVLTHYALKKQEARDLKLVNGEGKGLKGLTGAGSGVVREKGMGTLEGLIEQINKLFEGAGINDNDQINVVASVRRYAISNFQLQREAIANGPLDFASSPTLPETIDEIIYTAGEGHQKAINVILEMSGTDKLVEILLLSGLQDDLRAQAEQDVLELE
ncbi:type I restriction endonuclease subunit R [Paeniglutamicibacter psychrophenolicus]|uniref:Type I restriction enzyme R subunit n=1 Tax=Paeniglutamicibacter psychrophenolicus TaxID=257454 RepID=A0ABS4WI57_9MICC|nr:type I restriction endonuclease [Paeniglutamicibacter psychrophenolicus]MBP2375623.1 type I restriction enzyme R subunit [Paeniglutamicibacter psychrophenolicus]